eukprot:1879809-Prymnesium_polylepis.1
MRTRSTRASLTIATAEPLHAMAPAVDAEPVSCLLSAIVGTTIVVGAINTTKSLEAFTGAQRQTAAMSVAFVRTCCQLACEAIEAQSTSTIARGQATAVP